MSYHLKLKVFEGPMDLLYHLIQIHEIDIYDIPIHEITDQYMLYLDQMQELDLDVTSEFLLMAATLMEIKSRMLLPNPNTASDAGEEEEDPRDELVAKLLEYRRVKKAAEVLQEHEYTNDPRFYKPQEDLGKFLEQTDPNTDLIMEQTDPQILCRIFEHVVLQAKNKEALACRPKPIYIARETYQVSQQIRKILQHLRSSSQPLSFRQFFLTLECRQEMVVTFLALLEMVHKGMAQVVLINNQMDAEIKEVT